MRPEREKLEGTEGEGDRRLLCAETNKHIIITIIK